LTKRGMGLLIDDRNAALELFNRVLTMDPDNSEVLGAIERLSRQRRWLRAAALGGGLMVVAVAGFILRENLRAGEEQAVAPAVAAPAPRMASRAATVPPQAPASARVSQGSAPAPDQPDQPDEPDDGDEGKQARPAGRAEKRERSGRRSTRVTADPAPSGRRVFTLNVSPVDSQYSIDGGAWQPIDGNRATIEVGPGESRISVRNRACCVDRDTVIDADRKAGTIDLPLRWLPASVTPRCDDPRAVVRIGSRSWRRNTRYTVPIKSVTGTEKVKITFFVDGTDKVDDQEVDVHYGESREVACSF
jgi:hypothetical protein